jgi:hypothetical protein
MSSGITKGFGLDLTGTYAAWMLSITAYLPAAGTPE